MPPVTTDKPATADELNKRANALAWRAVERGQPVHVANHHKPWVQILPDDLARRALEARAEKEAAAGAAA